MDFLNTVPEFTIKEEDGSEKIDMTLGMEYYKICEKMVDDALLLKVKNLNPAMRLTNVYLSVHSVNSQAFIDSLDYGVYDFKYRGFTYTYSQFKDSLAPVVGLNKNGDADIGTVVQIPFDSEGGFAGKRFDIMGFGICLPAKYLEGIKDNPTVKNVHLEDCAYSI